MIVLLVPLKIVAAFESFVADLADVFGLGNEDGRLVVHHGRGHGRRDGHRRSRAVFHNCEENGGLSDDRIFLST